MKQLLATLEVQKAIYDTLKSYGVAVYSTLPINTKLPYVQFTGISVLDKSNKSDKRQTYIVSLSAWCIDTTSMNIHTLTEIVLELEDEELDLGESYSHDITELEYLDMSQDELNTEVVNRAIIEFKITVSKN